ncbi:MAG: hypothetical protein ACLSA6_00640 [Holdemania massiliensis]
MRQWLPWAFVFSIRESLLPTGATLNQIDAIDDSEGLFNQYPAQLVCLCDVTNPLFDPLEQHGSLHGRKGLINA